MISLLKHVRDELETMSSYLPLEVLFQSRPYATLKEKLDKLIKEIDVELR